MRKKEEKIKNTMQEVSKKKDKKTSSKAKKTEKVNIVTKLKNFISDVKVEFKRVKWPSKKEMVKYSVAVILFIVSCSLFFYLLDIIVAALHSISK